MTFTTSAEVYDRHVGRYVPQLSRAYCASLDAERQSALREACFRRLGSPTGSFLLTARAWYAAGRT
jgi:hypothetical protein